MDESFPPGTVELGDNGLALSTNCKACSERGCALLSAVLGDLVGRSPVETQAFEGLMALPPHAPHPGLRGSCLSEEERRAAIRALTDRYDRGPLDQPVPALGNPAARTAAGRARVVDRLKPLENYEATFAGQDDGIECCDVGRHWKEPGVESLRR